LAEFTRVYLRSLECPAIVPEIRGEDNDHFAALVAEGMKKAKLALVFTGPSVA
jgi:hypothetical protein